MQGAVEHRVADGEPEAAKDLNGLRLCYQGSIVVSVGMRENIGR